MYAYMYDIDMCDRSVICNILVVLVVLAGLVVLFMMAFCLVGFIVVVGLICLVIARDLAGVAVAGGASLVEESLEGRGIERGGPRLVDEVVDRALGELVHGRVLARGLLDVRDDALLVLAVDDRPARSWRSGPWPSTGAPTTAAA